MCGIVGYVGKKQVVPLIIDGLRKLEYRGYDSAGIAVVDEARELQIRRAEGKLRNLEEVLRQKPLDGTYGVGHTRWATHGRPTEENAHPHRDCTGRVVVVHNGIIENYLQLKDDLRSKDHRFVTETDTEIVAHLIEEYLKEDDSFDKAVRRACRDLRGIFALSILSTDEPDMISVVARQTLIQMHTPDAMRGRVSAVNSMFVTASNQLGDFRAGVVAAWLGAFPAALIGGSLVSRVAPLDMVNWPGPRWR